MGRMADGSYADLIWRLSLTFVPALSDIPVSSSPPESSKFEATDQYVLFGKE
jgi:hypothetical protein